MTTKSAVQIIAEGIEAKQRFATMLENLDNQYDIKDNIFWCNKKGMLEECEIGYYGQVAEYDTLTEAIENFNIYTQGLRIHDDKYAVGHLYYKLSDVKENLVIDIAESKIL